MENGVNKGSGDFSLDDIQANLVSAEQYQSDISGRDKKINDLITGQQQLEQSYAQKLADMETKFNQVSQQLSQHNQVQQQRSYELSPEEREAVEDQLPAFNKLVSQGLSPAQQKIDALESQLAELKGAAGSLDAMNQRLSQMDEIINRTSQRTIGASSFLNDQAFVEKAKETKFSPYSDRTLWDEIDSHMSVKPGDQNYSTSQAALARIFEAERATLKQDVPGTPATSGQHKVQHTPQQEKAFKKVELARALRSKAIDDGNIVLAEKIKNEQVLPAEFELGQLTGK